MGLGEYLRKGCRELSRSLGSFLEGEGRVRDYIPCGVFLDDQRMLLTQDGAFQSLLQLSGPDEEYLPSEQRAQRREAIAQRLKALASSSYSVVLHTHYRFYEGKDDHQCSVIPSPDTPLPSLFIHEEEKQRLRDRNIKTSLTQTISLKPGALSRLTKVQLRKAIEDAAREMSAYEETLGGAFSRVHLMDRDETLQELATYLCGRIEPAYVKPILLTQSLRLPKLETEATHLKIGDSYIGVASITGVDAHSEKFLALLRDLHLEIELVVRLRILRKEEQVKFINGIFQKKAVNGLKVADLWDAITGQAAPEDVIMSETNESLYGQQMTALNGIREGEVAFAISKVFVVVRASSPNDLSGRMQRVLSALADGGTSRRSESLFLLPQYLSGIPGNRQFGCREMLLSTDDLKHLVAVSTPWPGAANDSHYPFPFFKAKGRGGEVFGFSVKPHDQGSSPHMLVLGGSGAGKSFHLLRCVAGFLLNRGTRVRILDNGFSARGFTHLCSGRHFDPAKGTISIDPIPSLTNENKDYVLSILLQVFEDARSLDDSIRIGADLQRTLDGALSSLVYPTAIRSLQSVAQQLPAAYRTVLESFIRRHERYLGSEHMDTRGSRVATVELSKFISSEASSYALSIWKMIIFQMIHPLDGTPTLLVIDEGAQLLAHPAFGRQIESFFATLRKYNVICILATQTPYQLFSNPFGKDIAAHVGNLMLLKNGQAVSTLSDGYSMLGLNEIERTWISGNTPPLRAPNLPSSYPVYIVRAEGRRLVDLTPGPLTCRLLSTDIFGARAITEPPQDVDALLRSIVEEVGGADSSLVPYFNREAA